MPCARTAAMVQAASMQLCNPKPTERRAWHIDSFFEHVFVISLRSRRYHRDHLRGTLAAVGASDIEFIDAIDGLEVMRANRGQWEHRMYTDEVETLSTPAGAIGCFLSHLAVHTTAKQRGLQTYLVLEDDVTLSPAAGGRFLRAISQLPETWNALYLGYNRYFEPSRDCRMPFLAIPASVNAPCKFHGGRAICPAARSLLHTHAIGFHARAWKWLLPLLSKALNASTRLMPIDLEIRFAVEHNPLSEVFVVLPTPVVGQNRSMGSTVHQSKGMYKQQRAMYGG
mmetsp:Transcript_7871/g.17227  ORF Transcript_7871/g.17227 Transcript_7871/m.17227 type:complete len:283 (+) Transcript_7871:3-851(+)